MTHDSAQSSAQKIIDQLDGILDQERQALLKGDLDRIAGFLEQKETLIDALNALEPIARPELQHLQHKVVRNQALLDGALQGIRKVAARMAAYRKIRRSMETYDESGRKQTIPGVIDHKVEKRA
jgi:ABC-type transporter Mla subunit MlaD